MAKKFGLIFVTMALFLLPVTALAQEGGPTSSALNMGLNALWVMFAFVLVLLMQGGFIMLETGSTRMKNAGHVAGKTIFTVGLAAIVFWAVGYGLIFGADGNAFIGLGNWFFSPSFGALDAASEAAASYPDAVFFLFQFAFVAVSLSIAWGGFAERAKLSIYALFTVLFVALIYPVIAHWIWSADGWLFGHKQDFAGSTVVHLTGACVALAATLLLRPRIGKYNKDGSANAILGHNQVFTALGVLLLWVGWFGFNAGSTVGVGDGFFAYVAFTTLIATGAGAVSSLFTSWMVSGKADITTTLNGTLAGLVAITASCAYVKPWAALVIGLIAGILVVGSMRMFEKLRIDDPIYALSVHGVAGIWGTLSNGIFAETSLVEKLATGKPGLLYATSEPFAQLWVQFYGMAICGLYAFVVSYVLLWILKKVIGLRVTEEQEIIGLDLSEHGAYGYPEAMKK